MRFLLLFWLLGGLATAEPRDLVYSRVDGQELHLDLYPASSSPAPLVVFLHGGGWRSGRRHLPHGGAELQKAGFALAAIDYRLVPRAVWPAQLEDAKTAVRYLRSHAPELGLDPSRFGAWGESAGGHLAALVGLVGPQAGLEGPELPGVSSAVQAVADWYGPTDFTAPDSTTSQGVDYVRGFLGDDPAHRRAASPALYAHTGAPPFLIMHGLQDGLVPYHQAEILQQRLRQAGTPVTLVPVDHAGHNFEPRDGQPAPDDGQRIQALVDFFRRTLRP